MPSEQPQRREKPKKASTLTMRLTQKTRDALEAAAEAEGRSISEMAERWLDMAATGKADFDGQFGGGALAEVMISAAAFAQALPAEIAALHPELHGVDPTDDLGVREALVGGMSRLIALSYPIRNRGNSTPDTNPARHALIQAADRLRLALIDRHYREPQDVFVHLVGALDPISVGDLRVGTLAALEIALEDMSEKAVDIEVETREAIMAALDGYRKAESEQIEALTRWRRIGANLADAIAMPRAMHRALSQSQGLWKSLENGGVRLGPGHATFGLQFEEISEQTKAVEFSIEGQSQRDP